MKSYFKTINSLRETNRITALTESMKAINRLSWSAREKQIARVILIHEYTGIPGRRVDEICKLYPEYTRSEATFWAAIGKQFSRMSEDVFDGMFYVISRLAETASASGLAKCCVTASHARWDLVDIAFLCNMKFEEKRPAFKVLSQLDSLGGFRCSSCGEYKHLSDFENGSEYCKQCASVLRSGHVGRPRSFSETQAALMSEQAVRMVKKDIEDILESSSDDSGEYCTVPESDEKQSSQVKGSSRKSSKRPARKAGVKEHRKSGIRSPRKSISKSIS